jgi:uroporphyrinogen-III synthase
MGNDLTGLRVLVTRPAHQAGPLVEKLAAAGAEPLLFPLLEITPQAGPELDAVLARLGNFDLAIFISPTAVKFGVTAAARHGGWPAGLSLAAVGPGTARELIRQLGREPQICPTEGGGSEALLAEPALQEVDGRRILIVRGAGGRETLARTLAERGARVEHAVVYRRQPPANAGPLNAALQAGEIDLILITSSEALDNLVRLTAPALRETLLGLPLLVTHPRQAERARALGFGHDPILAREGSDAAIIDAITRLRAPA